MALTTPRRRCPLTAPEGSLPSLPSVERKKASRSLPAPHVPAPSPDRVLPQSSTPRNPFVVKARDLPALAAGRPPRTRRGAGQTVRRAPDAQALFPPPSEHAHRAAHGRACPDGLHVCPPLGHLTLSGHGQESDPADGWRYESSTDPADVHRPDRCAALTDLQGREPPRSLAHPTLCLPRKRARRTDQPVFIFKNDRAAALPPAAVQRNPG